MQSPERSSQSGGGDFAHVHGCQACAQTAEHADEEAANDDHLERLSEGGQAHQAAAHQGQNISDHHGLFSGDKAQYKEEKLKWIKSKSMKHMTNFDKIREIFWNFAQTSAQQ